MLEGYVEEQGVEDELSDSGVIVQPSVRGGYRIEFPRGRNLGASIGMTIAFLVIAGITVGISIADAPLIFPIVFGGFGLLFLWVVLDCWLTRHEVDVRPGSITFSGGMFSSKQSSLSAGQIRTISARGTMQAGTKNYYDVQVESTADKRHTLGKRIPSRATADRLVALIRETIEA